MRIIREYWWLLMVALWLGCLALVGHEVYLPAIATYGFWSIQALAAVAIAAAVLFIIALAYCVLWGFYETLKYYDFIG